MRDAEFMYINVNSLNSDDIGTRTCVVEIRRSASLYPFRGGFESHQSVLTFTVELSSSFTNNMQE